jgi:hypothetical protein
MVPNGKVTNGALTVFLLRPQKQVQKEE